MTPVSLRRALDDVGRPLRGASGLARALAGIAATSLIFAATAWMVRLGWLAGPEPVLAIWLVTVAVMAVAVFAARRAMRAFAPDAVGAELERLGGWRRGALTTVLEAPVPGTSSSLHEAAVSRRSAEVASDGATTLAGAVAIQLRRGRRAALAAAVGLAVLAAARPVGGPAARIWHPVLAWRALVAPVRLSARQQAVARGGRATLDIVAFDRQRATLFTRAPGEAWTATPIVLDTGGRATYTSPPLEADLVARVEAGGRRSPEVHVGIRLTAFLGALTVTAHYPAYLGLDDEVLPATGDTLLIPEGSRLAIAGRATAPIGSARLVGNGEDVSLPVAGKAFRGDVSPRRSGTWRLIVTSAGGGALEGDVPSLPIRVVADSAPIVDIPVPGADTLATPAMALAVVVGVRDDHGITAAAIEARRGAGPTVRLPLELSPGTPDRALIATSIDLTALGARPGDTVRYAGVAQDNAPAHHTGRSREFLVRIPTEVEQRAARNRQTAATATGFDSLSTRAAQVQQTEEDLSRERQRGDPDAMGMSNDGDGRGQPLSSEAARKAQAAAQAQQQVLDDAAKLRQSVEQLRDAAQRQSVADTALARELDDIGKLLDRAMTPELRDRLTQLQQALRNLDADQAHDALQQLAQLEAQLKEAMDQARELFRRAALENDLASLRDDARDLAHDQHDLTPRLGHADSNRAADESALAKRADSLAGGLDRTATQAPAQHTADQLRSAAKQASVAAANMRAAAQASQAGDASGAQSAAKQAEEQLDPLSKEIDQDRDQMQAEMRADIKAALDRALGETGRLARQQLAVADAFQRGTISADTRIEEGLMAEGTAKLLQQVAAVAAKNALVSPQASVALAEARLDMRDAVVAVSSVNPNLRDAQEKAGNAVDDLALAAWSLMQSKDRVNGSQSGSGVQEAIQQMQQMAGKQGQLAQQGAAMMQSGQMNAQQLMQMALQQRALQQQLDRLRAGGALPGAGDMSREAKDLSRSLAAAQLNQDVVARQQRLFKRMLDAGRLLQGNDDDTDQKRQATTARDAPPAIPPALDPRIRNGTDDIRLPSWEALQRLSPDERRQVLEYFSRLTRSHAP